MADFVYNPAMCDEIIPRKPIRADDPCEGGFNQRWRKMRAAQQLIFAGEHEGSDETSGR
jgi:hypothetical protein